MTLTFNPKKYSDLLDIHLPRVIKTEEENEYFLAIVEGLMYRSSLSPEEETLLELLVALIEDFEDKHYQLNASTPHSMLLHLMDAQSLQEEDLIPVFGSREITSEIVNRRQGIGPEQAKALAEFFRVDADLFL